MYAETNISVGRINRPLHRHFYMHNSSETDFSPSTWFQWAQVHLCFWRVVSLLSSSSLPLAVPQERTGVLMENVIARPTRVKRKAVRVLGHPRVHLRGKKVDFWISNHQKKQREGEGERKCLPSCSSSLTRTGKTLVISVTHCTRGASNGSMNYLTKAQCDSVYRDKGNFLSNSSYGNWPLWSSSSFFPSAASNHLPCILLVSCCPMNNLWRDAETRNLHFLQLEGWQINNWLHCSALAAQVTSAVNEDK